MLRCLLFGCCWLLLALPGSLAQTAMLISEGISIRNDYGYELIGRLRDRLLLFRDKYDEFEIQAYDNQLRPAWNKELEDLDSRNGIQVLTVLAGKNDFSIIFKMRRRGQTMVKIHKYDPGANLIDTLTIKNYGERMFDPPALEVEKSEDRNCLLVYNVTAPRSGIEMTCFRLDKMQVMWDKRLTIEEDYLDAHFKGLTLSNRGEMFMVGEYNNRRNKGDEHELRIIQVGAGDERVTRMALRDYLTTDAKFIFDNRHQCLVGAGLYGEKNRERCNGTFYLTINQRDSAASVLRYEPFDDQLLSILRRKDVADDSKGVPDAVIQQVILREDGGVLVVAERHHEISRGAVAGRGLLRDGYRVVVDFYYEDLFLVGTNPDGSVHWRTVLHKKQYSQDDDAIFSSFFLHRGTEQLRFLFNDEIKYENTCSEYNVSAVGRYDRNSLLNTLDQNLRLRFRDGVQISASECLIPSEFRNKLRLVLIRY